MTDAVRYRPAAYRAGARYIRRTVSDCIRLAVKITGYAAAARFRSLCKAFPAGGVVS